jgi:flavin-dependent dehydrogenase
MTEISSIAAGRNHKLKMKPSALKTDVVVAGSGPAGAVTALLLSRSGFDTLLLDAMAGTEPRIGETLTPRTNDILQSLGLLDSVHLQGHLPAEGVLSIWGSDKPCVYDFFSSSHGLGWHLDRTRFDNMIVEQCRIAGACILRPARIRSCERVKKQEWQLSLTHEQTNYEIIARYLVDATGKSGFLARGSLPQRITMDRLIGIAGFFPTVGSSGYTLVEAVDDGWFYSAALPAGRSVMVYFTDADLFASRCKEDSHYRNRQLDKAPHTRERLRQLDPAERPIIRSAATSLRMATMGEDWIAVGDAAQSFDPLCSLGIFQALDSATRAQETIVGALEGRCIGSGYQRWTDHIFTGYQRNYSLFYGNEVRWPHSAFWRRRHTGVC